MTKEDYNFHVKEEKKCHVRGDILIVLRKLDIIDYKLSRANLLKMLGHVAQQESYKNQDLTTEEYERKYE